MLLTFFFSKNISVYARFNNQNFNDTLTKNIVTFEQLGLVCEDAQADPTFQRAHMQSQ